MILSDVFRGIGHMTTSRYLSQQPFTHDSIVRSPELTKLPAELDSKATNRAQIKRLAVSLPKKTTAFEQSGLSRSFCQLRLVKIKVSRINSYSCKNLLMADSRYKIRRNPFYKFFMDLTVSTSNRCWYEMYGMNSNHCERQQYQTILKFYGPVYKFDF